MLFKPIQNQYYSKFQKFDDLTTTERLNDCLANCSTNLWSCRLKQSKSSSSKSAGRSLSVEVSSSSDNLRWSESDFSLKY